MSRNVMCQQNDTFLALEVVLTYLSVYNYQHEMQLEPSGLYVNPTLLVFSETLYMLLVMN